MDNLNLENIKKNVGLKAAQEAMINNGLDGVILPISQANSNNKIDCDDVRQESGNQELKRQLEENIIQNHFKEISANNLEKIGKFRADLMLPKELQDFVISEAKRKPVACELVAIPLIVGLSSLVAGKMFMRPKQQDDFLITPNLWGFTIANPSSKKSSAMKDGLFFFDGFERVAQEKYELNFADYNKSLNEYNIAKKAYESDLEKAFKVNNSEKIAQAKQKLSNLQEPQKVSLERFRIQDSTTQKITEILRDSQSNSILLEKDEISGFLSYLDKKENESDRAYFLQSWNGDTTFRSDTIGRGSIAVKNASISIVGTTQPDKVKNYLDRAEKGNNDGLLQRFQLMVYPDPIEMEYIDEEPDYKARSEVAEIANSLLNVDFSGFVSGYITKEERSRPYVSFDQEAQKIYIKWCNALFKKIRNAGEGGRNLFAQHLGKYEKLLPAIALIFHLSKKEKTQFINKEALITAILLCNYLENHAKRIYGMLESTNRFKDRALILLDNIKKDIKVNKNSLFLKSFSARDLKRKCSPFNNADLVNILDVLIEHKYFFKKITLSKYRQKTKIEYSLNKAFINKHR